MRWESSDIGAMLHVAPVPGTMALSFPDVLKIEEDAEKKYKSAIVFDVDYYTIAHLPDAMEFAGGRAILSCN